MVRSGRLNWHNWQMYKMASVGEREGEKRLAQETTTSTDITSGRSHTIAIRYGPIPKQMC